jgi:hypothetical protein
MTTIPMGSVAGAMAGAGLHIFPVLAAQKRPATRNGLKAATTDQATIRRWWQANPDFNIGISCGPSRLVVIDCDAGKPWPADDDPPQGVQDGADVLQLLADEHDDQDLLFRDGAVTVATPSGGLHLYFQAPAGRVVKSSAGRLGPWLDVRAAGGYVVAPFSSTPAGHYRPVQGWRRVVVTDASVDFEPIGVPSMDRLTLTPPPLPGWLAGLLAPRQDDPPSIYDRLLRALDAKPVGNGSAWAMGALARESTAVAQAAVGTRNDVLNRASFALGQLVGAGLLTEAEVVSTLHAAAATAGLEPSEAEACVRSGLRAGKANPRDVTGIGAPS